MHSCHVVFPTGVQFISHQARAVGLVTLLLGTRSLFDHNGHAAARGEVQAYRVSVSEGPACCWSRVCE